MLQHGIVLCAAIVFTASVRRPGPLSSLLSRVRPRDTSIISSSQFLQDLQDLQALQAHSFFYPRRETRLGNGMCPDYIRAVAERVSVPLLSYSGQVSFLLAESLNGMPGTVLDSVVFGSAPSSPLDLYTSQFPPAPVSRQASFIG